MNLLVKVPGSPQIGEVQLHLAGLERVKSGPEHKLYELLQDITRAAKAQNRPLTKDETDVVALIEKTGMEIYPKALKPYMDALEPAKQKEQQTGVDPAVEKRAYDELMTIKSLKFTGVPQQQTDLDALIAEDAEAHDELAGVCRAVASAVGGDARIPPPKSKKRAQDKLGELDGDATRITDIARSSVVCDSFDQLLRAFRMLAGQADLIQIKNKFLEPQRNDYRDINVLIRAKKVNHVGEMQLHLRAIEQAKSGVEHELYAKAQEFQRAVPVGPLNKTETHFIERIGKMGQQIYGDAFDVYHRLVKGIT